MASFPRPIGPKSDLSELEYVSSLHQTAPTLRTDGTVSSDDVRIFLRSRYGLDVGRDAAAEVVRGLNGDATGASSIVSNGAGDGRAANDACNGNDGEADEAREDGEAAAAYLDIVQLLSVVLMPTLAKMGRDHRQGSAQEEEEEEGDDEGKMAASPTMRRPRVEGMMRDVLSIMLTGAGLWGDAASSDGAAEDKDDAARTAAAGAPSFPPLTESLVRRLLEAHYEYERAADADLVRDMVTMAADAAGDASGRLDVDAFVRALTADLDLWEVGSDDRLSTTFYDVFGYDTEEGAIGMNEKEGSGEGDTGSAEAGKAAPPTTGTSIIEDEGASGQARNATKEGRFDISFYVPTTSGGSKSVARVVLKPTASFIDWGADTHRSLIFLVVLFLFYITTSLVYMTLFQGLPVERGITCDSYAYGCSIGAKIARWLMIAAGLTLSGYMIMLPISLANNPTIRSNKITAGCWVLAATYTAIPFAFIYSWRQQGKIAPPYESTAQQVADEVDFELSQIITLVAGCILCLLLLGQFWLNSLTAKQVIKGGKQRSWAVAHNVRASLATKRAGTYKLNSMLRMARALHPDPFVFHKAEKRGHVEEALTNYFKYGQIEVECGGTFWTWRRIWSKELFHTEGIWLHSRMWCGQTAQVVIAVFLAVSFFLLIPFVAKEADDMREDILKYDDLPQWIYDFVPTSHQVKCALYPASCLSLLVSLKLISIYIPSTVKTIISFRSGIYGSLHDNDFQKYRIAADAAFMNVGNMLYAMFGSVTLFFILWALFIFLNIWPITADIMKTVYAWVIGLIITTLLKVLLIKTCRVHFHKAFYRTRPAGANFAGLALECWHIGLGGGVLVGRIVQFFLASTFFIGRTDVPYLSPFVAVGGYRFDMVPTAYWKDILGHEAHRHPYIERLSAMYMMRLVHGSKFSSRAGACWRQLFVVALFPWMAKHRVFESKRKCSDENSTTAGVQTDEDKVSKGEETANAGAYVDIFLRNLANEAQNTASLMVQEVASKERN